MSTHPDAAASKVSADEINAFLSTHFTGTSNQCESIGSGWAVALLSITASSLRPGGIISGPTMFGACDAALYYACFSVIGVSPMTVTSEMSIQFLRAATGSELRARADLVKVGRRAIVGTVTAWTDDPTKPVAVAQGTYMPPMG